MDNATELWGRFLHVRMRLIHAWVSEGQSFVQIAETLSMDAEQVELISHAPDQKPDARARPESRALVDDAYESLREVDQAQYHFARALICGLSAVVAAIKEEGQRRDLDYNA
jgi:hypothetical protein